MLRTEEWTKDVHGMTSTLLVEVLEGERVNVMPTIVKELGLAGEAYCDIVPTGKDYFAMQFEYGVVASALIKDGWGHASTKNAG